VSPNAAHPISPEARHTLEIYAKLPQVKWIKKAKAALIPLNAIPGWLGCIVIHISRVCECGDFYRIINAIRTIYPHLLNLQLPPGFTHNPRRQSGARRNVRGLSETGSQPRDRESQKIREFFHRRKLCN
jgi:hypothetical protein